MTEAICNSALSDTSIYKEPRNEKTKRSLGTAIALTVLWVCGSPKYFFNCKSNAKYGKTFRSGKASYWVYESLLYIFVILIFYPFLYVMLYWINLKGHNDCQKRK